MNNETCPWCQTDIIWDEEIGREETCPHCYNDLNKYRSIEINVKEEPEESEELILNKSDINEDDIPQEIEELIEDIVEEPEELLQYETKVEEFLNLQEDSLVCTQCNEPMVFAGEQKMNETQYSPGLPLGISKPFLAVPFTVDVHLCPSCFEFRYILSEGDRIKLLNL